jgi:hypothetical protein
MKKVFSILFGGSLLFMAASVSAQENSFAANGSVSNFSYSGSKAGTKSLDLVDVNASALADFSSKYKDAEEVKWSAGNKTLSVYFKQNDVPMRSTYTENGKLEYTICYYVGSHVPEKIKNLIKRNRYDMEIMQVTEIQRRHQTIDLVRLEDAHTILTLRVEGNSVEPYETLTKD